MIIFIWMGYTENGIQEDSTNGKPIGMVERKKLSSVSTALILAIGIGIFEAVALSLGCGSFLNLMGITVVSFTYTKFT
jgi:hypothetical protein